VGPTESGREAVQTVVIAVLCCDGCGREYFSADVPRVGLPVPPCDECGGPQRLHDLIVSE